MKRSHFLTAIAAVLTAPLLSFSKESKSPETPYLIFRRQTRIPADQWTYIKEGYGEETMDNMMLHELAHDLSQVVDKRTIINPDGSVEKHITLRVYPSGKHWQLMANNPNKNINLRQTEFLS